MKHLFFIIVALLCVAAFTQPIQACQCFEYGTPICARFWRSDAVFLGEVVDVQPLPKKPDDVYAYLMISFAVRESFRGVSGPRIGVATATTMCDTVFKKGKRYLVYASLNPKTNQLFTGMCTGTGLAHDDIEKELKPLRQLKLRQAEESISGRLKTYYRGSMAGIKVEVISSDKTYQTLTNKYGDYSFPLPGPGSFKVRVIIPYQPKAISTTDDNGEIVFADPDAQSTFEYDVTLEKSQCSYREIEVHGADPDATATVGGGVVTATGEGVDTGRVQLINVLNTGADYGAGINKDGSFRFENVAPALWKDGRAVEYPYIKVYSGDEYVRRVEITSGGTFKFSLYGDFDYSIEAHDDIEEIEGRSQRIKIPQGNSTGLKLVIQRIKQ